MVGQLLEDDSSFALLAPTWQPGYSRRSPATSHRHTTTTASSAVGVFTSKTVSS